MAFGIAVLGLDHWYTAFGVLDICAASQTTPLVSVYEPDSARRAEIVASYPGILVTDSAEEALAAPGVELAAICAKTGDAVSLSRQALLAGKHVVSVKPFARTNDEARDIVQVAVLADKFFGSFEGMQRLHSRAEILRSLIQSGAIGDIIAFHQVGHGSLPAPWRGAKNGGPSWWLDPEQVPGGAWLDHAIYAIDLALFALNGPFTGRLIEDTVSQGQFSNRIHKQLRVEDYGTAIMMLRSYSGADITLNITDTWCAEPGTGYSEYRFLGNKGTIFADGAKAWVVQTKDGTTHHSIPTEPFFRFDKLATLLQQGSYIPFGGREALTNLAYCLSAYASRRPV